MANTYQIDTAFIDGDSVSLSTSAITSLTTLPTVILPLGRRQKNTSTTFANNIITLTANSMLAFDALVVFTFTDANKLEVQPAANSYSFTAAIQKKTGANNWQTIHSGTTAATGKIGPGDVDINLGTMQAEGGDQTDFQSFLANDQFRAIASGTIQPTIQTAITRISAYLPLLNILKAN